MARTDFTVEEVPYQETYLPSPQTPDTVNGNMFENDGTVVISVLNRSGSPCNVTIYAVGDLADRIVNQEVTVAASNARVFAPLRPIWWNQRTGDDIGKVYLDFSNGSVLVFVTKFNF